MDAVISIGGQSFLDGILRILGPAMEPLNAPIPVALPGVSNGLLAIRTMRSVRPSGQQGRLELELELDLKGEVLFVASVASPALALSGDIALNATPGAATIREPQRDATLQNVTGNGSLANGVTLTITSLTGNVRIPPADIPVDLAQILGSISIPPAGAAAPGLPLPGVVPVPLHFNTPAQPLIARVFLTPTLNGRALGADAVVDGSTDFGLQFDFGTPTVQPAALPAAFPGNLQNDLTSALHTLTAQLLRVQPAIQIVQPAYDLTGVATDLAAAIPAALHSALVAAFSGLRARTGRLLYPAQRATTSCELRALPTVGKARVAAAPDGSLLLQLGFDRNNIGPNEQFPAFAPQPGLDTRVTLSNAFLCDLLVCLIEQLPNITVTPGSATRADTPTTSTADWNGVRVRLGSLSLTGSLQLTIAQPAGAAAAAPKVVRLAFTLTHTISAPVVIDIPLFEYSIGFVFRVDFDLDGLASVTGLRRAALNITPFSVGLSGAMIALLVTSAVAIAILPVVGPTPLPIIWGGFAVLAFLIGTGPLIVTAIIAGFVKQAIRQLLSGLRLLKSPAAVPPGVFDAFGKLVATSLEVDDLDARGVLDTPTSPWAVMPTVFRGLTLTPIDPRDIPGWPGGPGRDIPIGVPGTTIGTRTVSGGG